GGPALAATPRPRADRRSSRTAAARWPFGAGDLGAAPVTRAVPTRAGGTWPVDGRMRSRADRPNRRSRLQLAPVASHEPYGEGMGRSIAFRSGPCRSGSLPARSGPPGDLG